MSEKTPPDPVTPGSVDASHAGELVPMRWSSLVEALLLPPSSPRAIIKDAQTGVVLAYAATDREEWICSPAGRRRVEADIYGRGSRRAA